MALSQIGDQVDESDGEIFIENKVAGDDENAEASSESGSHDEDHVLMF